MDDSLLRATAALQANFKMLEAQADAFTELSDMQAVRQFKTRLEDYIGAHVAKETLPPDPYGLIAERLIEVARFFEEAEKESDSLLNWKKDWLNKVPKVGLANLQAAQAELEELIHKLPHIQARLRAMIHPLDWDEAKTDLHPELLICAACLNRVSLPKDAKQRADLFHFAHGNGELSKRVSQHISDLRKRLGELEQLHAGHVEQLQVAQQQLAHHNFRSAAGILEQLEKNFTDIPYAAASEALENLMAKHREFKNLYQSLAENLRGGGWKNLPDEFDRHRRGIAKPDSELGRECLALLDQMESRLYSFLAARKAKRIKAIVVAAVLATFVTTSVLWANHQTELRQAKADAAAKAAREAASAKAKAAREAAWAKAKATREAAEAKAKAAREAAEAKAKAEREAAEAKAKLSAEISQLRVGSTLLVPIATHSTVPMQWCPAGRFTMGSPFSEIGRSSDENQVRVTLSKGFLLAKTEVTQAQWQVVMGGNPSSFKGANLPVENVSWNDVQEFIERVNASGVIPAGWKMALPTEAQWEYACRAGETGPYSGGSLDEVAWYDDISDCKTHEVGTKKPNTWGLHDMHGNVWEWCADWYGDELPGGTDPTEASWANYYELYRVNRGGSWRPYAAHCRAAQRFRRFPGARSSSLGFRPALVPSE